MAKDNFTVSYYSPNVFSNFPGTEKNRKTQKRKNTLFCHKIKSYNLALSKCRKYIKFKRTVLFQNTFYETLPTLGEFTVRNCKGFTYLLDYG